MVAASTATEIEPRSIPREVALKRARDAIADNRLDALVASSHASTFCLAGTNFVSQRALQERLALVVVEAGGDPVFIVERSEADEARARSWVADIRIYREFAEDPIDVLASVLRELGVSEGRIGIEKDMMSARHSQLLRKACPKAVLVDADPILQHMRAIKTSEEVHILGELALNTIRAIHSAFKAAKIGDSERQVGERMKAAAREMGLHEYSHLILGTGANALKAHHEPDDTKLSPSTILRVDMGLMDRGYTSDVARTVIVGPPLPHQIETYKKLEAIFGNVVEAMRPGALASDIYRVYLKACERYGAVSGISHVGHSISMNVQKRFETPALHARDHSVLETGMVFMVEPYIRGEGANYHVEDLIEIRSNGPRIWSRTPEWDLTEPMIVG